MAKRPDQRYPTAGGVAGALRDAVTGAGAAGEGPVPAGRSRAWLAAAAAIAAVAAIVVVVALSRGDGGSGHSPTPSASGVAPGQPPPPSSVNRIDPATGAVTLTANGVIGLGATRTVDPSLAVGEGGVWALTWALSARPSLTAIDETTGAVRDRIAVSPTSFGGMALAVADRTVWFTGGDETGERVQDSTRPPWSHSLRSWSRGAR